MDSIRWKSPQQLDRSNVSRKKRACVSPKAYTEFSSDSETEEETPTQTKARGKVKSNKAKDKTIKNPIAKSRNKTTYCFERSRYRSRIF